MLFQQVQPDGQTDGGHASEKPGSEEAHYARLPWGRHSCLQPAFSLLDPLESGSAAWKGCRTVQSSIFMRITLESPLADGQVLAQALVQGPAGVHQKVV